MKEKRITIEEVVVGVDITKNILDVAVSNLNETRQLGNKYESIMVRSRFIAGFKHTRVILEETADQPVI